MYEVSYVGFYKRSDMWRNVFAHDHVVRAAAVETGERLLLQHEQAGDVREPAHGVEQQRNDLIALGRGAHLLDERSEGADVPGGRRGRRGRLRRAIGVEGAGERLEPRPRGGRQRGRGVIPVVTNRDLRRTWKTLAGKAGVSKEIRDRLQNHTLQDVSSKHYDRWQYMPEKREGMNKWNAFVTALLASKEHQMAA